MPPTAQGTAIYKKKAGTLSVIEDEEPPVLLWKCIDQSVEHPLVEIPLDDIVSLKVTPATSAKMMAKIGLDPNKPSPKGVDGKKHKNDVLFSFNSRVTMDAVKVALQQIISRKKNAQAIDTNAPPVSSKDCRSTPTADSTGSGSGATSSTVPGTRDSTKELSKSRSGTPDLSTEKLNSLLDDKSLLKNLTLQQKLLRENPQLMQTFTEAVIKSGLEPEEFWSTRIHLLRSYAIQSNQKRGPYNVLSTIKPVASSDNEVNVSVTREKIHEIFKQYPIVRKAYDDNVPKISEGEFWSRFFSSKLFRRLRGEKINVYDRGDITLDKYLYYDADYDGEEDDEDLDKLLEEKDKDRGKNKDQPSASDAAADGEEPSSEKKRRDSNGEEEHLTASKKKIKLFRDENVPISKCIDIAANDEDDPERKGNTPDITMKEDQDPDLVNVVRTMNRLSRRMMTNVRELHNRDLDAEFKGELELKDLDDKETVEYNELKYTQRSKAASGMVPTSVAKKAMNQSDLNPDLNDYDKFMDQIKGDSEKLDLTSVYYEVKKPIYDAYKDVTGIVKKNSKQSSQSWSSHLTDALSSTDKKDAPTTIPSSRLESIRLTHSTSIEFLRHFWLHFNSISSSSMSTNPNFKQELLQLRKCYISITKCLERVKANLVQTTGPEHTAEEKALRPLVESLQEALAKYEAAIIQKSTNH